ncbi:MAG: Bug family tripartite tricarboxylate transporter substrate binding protein [Thermocrispum sp.]
MKVRRFAATAATAATAAAALAAVTMLSGCDAAAGGSGDQMTGLRIMVPNAPGGGYDITARTSAKVMEEAEVARNVEVFNLPGAGGTVGLGRLVGEKGNGKLAMQMGLGVVGAALTNESPATLQETTPIAKLIEEPDILVVSAKSKYRTLEQLIADWEADPGGVPVGGGSSSGGPDHLAAMLSAEGAGIDPKDVNYVPYDGGGDLLAAILGDKVAFGVSGVSEWRDQIDAGQLRVLAVTSAERADGIDAPTLTDSGVDVEFTNWRGVVAPPGISDADRKALVGAYQRMHDSPQWQRALKKNGWADAFQTGDEFGAFLKEQNTRVESVLRELGLA